MTTKPDELDIPDNLIVPLDQGAPNPYDDPAFDGKQDKVTDENRVDGLGGGDTFPESPLTVNDALSRLHDLVTSHATTMWSGLPIKGYCLAVQHESSEIGALHATAWDDWTSNPDQHPCTFDDVDWTKVPRGVWCYNQSGAGGSGAGHIYRFCGIHNGKPLFCTNDAIPGQMSYLNDPTWFRVHWGQELVGWARVCNGVWQKGIPGNDPNPPPKKPPVHKNLEESRPNVARAHTLIEAALKDNADNPEFVAEFQPVADALGVAFRKIYAKTK